MAALTVKATAARSAGLDLSAALDTPAAGGDTIPAGGDIYFRIKTTGTGSTVTAIAAGTVAVGRGRFAAPYTIGGGAIPATSDKVYGPFGADFADPGDGLVHVAYTSVTGMTVACYRLTND